ncbi:MAG: glycine/betaine/sarcosine/D-proline family reductase selenoprotein B [Pseudonocardiaceae bacterium]
MRLVHYINQFYAGLGGEDAANLGPRVLEGPVGPGRLLQQLLGEGHQIVATVVCGDDYAASDPGVCAELLAMARSADGELLIAGPAFGSGRYGLVCARLVAAAHAAGLPAVASMHPENPGISEAGAAPVVAAGAIAREMRPTMQRLAAAVGKLASGATLTADDGRVTGLARIGRLVEQRAAARAVELMLRRLGGDRDATEVPVGGFDTVVPAAPVDKAASASIALVTEGAVVPLGNPDRLESARATRWLRYPIDGVDALVSGTWESVAGGFATTVANADPHRLLPLDAARALEREGAIGHLHGEILTTLGNGTPVATAQRFGVEWAAELRKAGVQAAILTAT